MGSYIQINSISIDLSQSIDNTDAGKCEHFSIRGYVSEIRKKDWKQCWPFPVDESDEQPSLPPLDVPKFRWWRCQNCQRETATDDIEKNDQIDLNCYHAGHRSDSNYNDAVVNPEIQQSSMPNSIVARREIDLNIPIDMNSDGDCIPIDEMENNTEVVLNRNADHKIDLENNHNRQVSSVPSPENFPGPIQEGHATIRDCEGNNVSNMEIDTSNLKYMDKSSSEVHRKGKAISADNQCQKELRKPSIILREATVVIEEHNATDDTTEHFPPELESELDDFQAGFSGKKPQKMRLLSEVMRETKKQNTEQITIQESASDCPSNVPTVAKRGPGSKRKLLLEAKCKPADMCFKRAENEVQNLEEDPKTIGNDPGNRSKRLRTGLSDTTKGHGHKPEVRSHTNIKKKNRKIQHVDNELISEPHQGRQRKLVGTMDASNNDDVSKNLSSGFFPCASTEKGMDNSSLHARRTRNEYNFSKGKGKMLQADEKLNSLSYWENDKPVEDSSALPGTKIMSIMPTSIPISSAQATPNGELKKGLHLSLNLSSSTLVFSNKSSHQAENQLTFPWPFQEGTSKAHLTREGSEIDSFGKHSIPSKHIKNAISGKGKGVNLKETSERYFDLTEEEESEEDTIDEATLEVAEILAKNQYERSLPDVENASGLPGNSTHKETPQVIGGENERDIDLNRPIIDLDKVDMNIGLEILSRTSAEYSSSYNHHGMKPQQNHGGSLELFSNDTIPAMNLLNLDSEILCVVSKNPADFTAPEGGNPYMINGEDLKFEKCVPSKRSGLPTPCGRKHKRNSNEGKNKKP